MPTMTIISLDEVATRPEPFRLGFADGYALQPSREHDLAFRTAREAAQYRSGHRAGRKFYADQTDL